MTEQEKRERVIEGLEYCNGEGLCVGKKCPYYEDEMCIETLHSDALALLKAQEPRTCSECRHYDIYAITNMDGKCRNSRSCHYCYGCDKSFGCNAWERR